MTTSESGRLGLTPSQTVGPFFGLLRFGHIVVAVMWMGLLWFFNFVQTPAYAEMEPPARNAAYT